LAANLFHPMMKHHMHIPDYRQGSPSCSNHNEPVHSIAFSVILWAFESVW